MAQEPSNDIPSGWRRSRSIRSCWTWAAPWRCPARRWWSPIIGVGKKNEMYEIWGCMGYTYICVCVRGLKLYIYTYDHIWSYMIIYVYFVIAITTFTVIIILCIHIYINVRVCVCVCWYSVCEIVLDMFATILKQVRSNTLIMTGRVRPPCHSPMIVWVGGIPTLWKMMEWVRQLGVGMMEFPNHQPVLFALTKGSLNDQ